MTRADKIIELFQGTPASVRIFLYPDFKDIYKSVANKSFFNADRVTIKWNPKGNEHPAPAKISDLILSLFPIGTALVFMAIADVDKTGASYYGEQHLYLMLTRGESFKVPLGWSGVEKKIST